MNIQKSFEQNNKGVIYIVPTPIGNLEDITFRAINVLKQSSVVAAEDTRVTKNLLNHFNIKTPLLSYHEHNKQRRIGEIMDRLKNKEQISLVSDAGMPAISDPGYELIKAAIEEDYSVIVLPGANAALCALIGSGLPTKEFLFYGFLPRKNKEKQSELIRLGKLQATIILYESPYRVKQTLEAILEHLGDRKIAIVRELTKRYEEYIRGKVTDVLNWFEENEPRGEFCIIIEGSADLVEDEDLLWWSHLSVKDHVIQYISNKDLSSKEAIKRVAKERKLPRREVYEQFHIK